MHQLHHRDLVRVLVHDRELLHLALHQSVLLANDMDLVMLVRHQNVVGNFQNQLMQDVVIVDALQIQDVPNLDEGLPFQDEVHRDVVRHFLVDVVADVEQNRQ